MTLKKRKLYSYHSYENLSQRYSNGHSSESLLAIEEDFKTYRKSQESVMTPPKRNSINKQFESRIIKLRTLKLKFPEFSETEEIINDFSCALKKDILVHGRLFIGLECIYFYSSILTYETKLCEKWDNITDISKAKLAHIIPNAIKICTPDARYTFASFTFRNYPFELLQQAIKNHKEKLNLTAPEIKEFVRSFLFPKVEKNGNNSSYDTPDSSSNQCDDMFSAVGVSSEMVNMINRASSYSTPIKNQKETKSINLSDPGLASTPMLKQLSQTLLNCCCEPYRIKIVRKLYHVNIDDIFNALYDESSTIMTNVYKDQNILDYKINSRKYNPDGSVIRESSNILHKAFMGKSSYNKLIEVFPSTNKPNVHYQIMGKSTAEGVPYADTFEILTNTCLRAKEPNQTFYRVSVEIRFKKALFGITKQLIEKQALKTSTSVINLCVNELTKLYGTPCDLPSKRVSEEKTDDKSSSSGDDLQISSFNSSETTRKYKNWKSLLKSLIVVLFVILSLLVIYQGVEIRYLRKLLSDC